MRAHPVDRLERLVADHPCVMAGRDVDDIVRAEIHLGPVVVPHMRASAHDVAGVVNPARRATHDRPHMLRPMPSRLMDVACNSQLTEVPHVGDAARKVLGLIGGAKVLALDAAHIGNPTTDALRFRR